MHLFIFLLSLLFSKCDEIPALNQKIVGFVSASMSKKIGRGECWDLAAEALDQAGARWDHAYGFGRRVRPGSECIYPGDIIQMESVEVQYANGNERFVETMDHHTAVVFRVNSNNTYAVAEQNTSALGRKVGLSTLDLKNVRRGTVTFFRPVQ